MNKLGKLISLILVDRHDDHVGRNYRYRIEFSDATVLQLVILDEICVAVSKGLVDERQVIEVVKSAADVACIVMTGRGATAGLIEIADTVSEIKCIKHGYEKGIKAQKGVEF